MLAGELKGVTSQRFSKTYNQDLAEWKDFWEEHKVPEAKHVPDVKNRLGNLFNIGAGKLVDYSTAPADMEPCKPGMCSYWLRAPPQQAFKASNSGSQIPNGVSCTYWWLF